MHRTHAARCWAACMGCLLVQLAWAQSDARWVGDMGLARYQTPAIAHTYEQKEATFLPYIYADYGAIYARVDTFGYKLTPMGVGHLEVATRLSFEGYTPSMSGVESRARPKPVGLGTFQETPYGAFIFYAFHDVTSAGHLLDVTYAAELALGDARLYPQIGVERRDRKYVEHLYGVDAQEAVRSGNRLTAYSTGASISPNLALALEYPLVDAFKLTVQVRKRWLDAAIADSPLVKTSHQTSSFIALSRAFH